MWSAVIARKRIGGSRGGRRGGFQPGRIRSPEPDDDDAQIYVGVASREYDSRAEAAAGQLDGSVTWGSNGEVMMDLQNCGEQVVRVPVKTPRLAYGAGCLVGFSFDMFNRQLKLFKNGECVHVIGPPSLYLDGYRSVCAVSRGCSISMMRTTTFA